MNFNRERTGIAIILVSLFAVMSYKSWTKSQKIEELESVIAMHKMYSTQDQLRSNYSRERILNTTQFRTLNDSLKILFTANNLTIENNGTNINFSVTAINKFEKEVKYINGTLSLRDSSQIIVSFPVEITTEFLPDIDTVYWRQSWNLDRYIPTISKALKSRDVKTLKTEWQNNVILFKDNSAFVLNERSD